MHKGLYRDAYGFFFVAVTSCLVHDGSARRREEDVDASGTNIDAAVEGRARPGHDRVCFALRYFGDRGRWFSSALRYSFGEYDLFEDQQQLRD
jgi:hypothetical protein